MSDDAKSTGSLKGSRQGPCHRLCTEAPSFAPKRAIRPSPLCSGQALEAKTCVYRVRRSVSGHPGITTLPDTLTSWRSERGVRTLLKHTRDASPRSP